MEERARTMNQINQNKQNGIVIDESLAEKKPRTKCCCIKQ
jgi:hypothetical protein